MIFQLYEGTLDPSARDLRQDSIYNSAMDDILRLETQLESLLPPDDRSLLEELTAAYAKQEGPASRHAFSDGFSIATALLVEALGYSSSQAR